MPDHPQSPDPPSSIYDVVRATPWGKYNPWSHQIAAVQKCIKLENEPTEVNNGVHVQAKMGLLTLSPGAGKTLIISKLVLVNTKEVCDISAPFHVSDRLYRSRMCIPIMKREHIEVMAGTSMIIVKNNLVSQWHECLLKTGVPDDSILVYVSKRQCTAHMHNLVFSGKHKVVLISDAMYTMLVSGPMSDKELLQTRCLQRLIIDEADTLAIQNFSMIPTNFLWFVTGTPGKYPRMFRYLFQCGMAPSHFTVNVKCRHPLPPMVKQLIAHVPDGVTVLKNEGMIYMEAVVKAQKSRETTNMNVPRLMKRPSEVNDPNRLCEKFCCLTLRRIEACASPTELPCCGRMVDGGHMARHFEEMKRTMTEDMFVPVCWSCNSLLPMNFPRRLPPPVPLETYTQTFLSLSVYSNVMGRLRNVIQEAEEMSKRLSIIVFTEASASSDMTANIQSEVQEFKYEVKRLSDYRVLQRRLDEFSSGGIILVLGSHQGQGLNIHFADVIFVLHTLTDAKFKQVVGRAVRPGRIDPVRVFHMQV